MGGRQRSILAAIKFPSGMHESVSPRPRMSLASLKTIMGGQISNIVLIRRTPVSGSLTEGIGVESRSMKTGGEACV